MPEILSNASDNYEEILIMNQNFKFAMYYKSVEIFFIRKKLTKCHGIIHATTWWYCYIIYLKQLLTTIKNLFSIQEITTVA